MDENYSNRELDRMFEEITQTLERIENQTTKTNGQVASLKMWRAYMTGALAIVSFFVAMVAIPVLSALLQGGKI